MTTCASRGQTGANSSFRASICVTGEACWEICVLRGTKVKYQPKGPACGRCVGGSGGLVCYVAIRLSGFGGGGSPWAALATPRDRATARPGPAAGAAAGRSHLPSRRRRHLRKSRPPRWSLVRARIMSVAKPPAKTTHGTSTRRSVSDTLPPRGIAPPPGRPHPALVKLSDCLDPGNPPTRHVR